MFPTKTRKADVEPIDVVIVSFNCSKHLAKCLNALRECGRSFNLRLVVVDNASSDGTVEWLRSGFQDVRTIENSQNVGFAAGCNVGMLSGRAEFVLLLNPDCVIDAESLHNLVECLTEHPMAACVAPSLRSGTTILPPVYRSVVTLREFLAKMLFLDRVASRIRPRKWLGEKSGSDTVSPSSKAQAVDYLVGACVLCRRAHLQSVGMFDPGFFLYFEDQDLSLRLRERGFDVMFCPDIVVEHTQGVSADQDVERTIFESYRSLCYFFNRHRSNSSRIALRLVIAIGVSIRLMVFAVAMALGNAEARRRLGAYWQVIREVVL